MLDGSLKTHQPSVDDYLLGSALLLSSTTRESSILGLLGSLAGVLIVGIFSFYAIEPLNWFIQYAGFAALSAFVTSFLLWRFFVERKKGYQVIRGMVIGALSGILSHFVFWYLQIVLYSTFSIDYSKVGVPPLNLFFAIPWAAGLFIWNMIIFGWLTVPLGSAIGGGYCWYLEKNK